MRANAPAPDATPTIDVVSDVVCPWCYVGKRRLEAALAARPALAPPVVRWHPFQLNPDIPADGVDRRSYLEAKFGGRERAREIYARVEAAGREAGIEFDFERIERQPNTVDAHRLIRWAQLADDRRADALVERLFRAYFTEGVDLGRAEALAALAGEAGLDASAAQAFLATDDGRAEVQAADARAKSMGVSGVPFFIFGRRVAVSGAQPADVLTAAMAQAQAVT
jgi:predicted DsbA family dithiol-disulfide isomerase